jgi:hypothetical protein
VGTGGAVLNVVFARSHINFALGCSGLTVDLGVVKSQDVVYVLGAPFVGEGVGGSGRLELGHLLLDLLVYVIVWSREDERDRLG